MDEDENWEALREGIAQAILDSGRTPLRWVAMVEILDAGGNVNYISITDGESRPWHILGLAQWFMNLAVADDVVDALDGGDE